MLARLMIGAIGVYRRYVSPMTPPSCRFFPSCSAYGAEAIERWGAARGSWLLLRRLLRCHPFCRGGWDPVPLPPEEDGAPPPRDHTSDPTRCSNAT